METVQELKKRIVENPTKEKHGFDILKMGIVNLQVCSKLSPDDVEMNVRRHSPSGTSNNWTLERTGNLAPVDCEDGGGAKHYIFSC